MTLFCSFFEGGGAAERAMGIEQHLLTCIDGVLRIPLVWFAFGHRSGRERKARRIWNFGFRVDYLHTRRRQLFMCRYEVYKTTDLSLQRSYPSGTCRD
jgi:hypothetical protein